MIGKCGDNVTGCAGLFSGADGKLASICKRCSAREPINHKIPNGCFSMSEYAKQCPKYVNVYHVKQERDCINCLYSDDANWSACAIDEMKWKQQRFKLSQVMGQNVLDCWL